MITKKLYDENAYLKQSEASLLATRSEKDGQWLLPDRTIFYPGGGGQPADSGWIDGRPIRAARAQEGQIWYRLDGPEALAASATVKMELDWERRYYHMQQHSGQHLLSSVFQDHNLETVSVHLGEEYTLIELDGPAPDRSLLARVEEQTNAAIRQGLAIRIHLAGGDDIKRFPLRKPPAGPFRTYRIVEIDGRDFSGCGGTHVATTSEIGLMKITGMEKIRGHVRIKARLGRKAYAYFDELHQMGGQLKNLLKTDVSAMAERLQALIGERSQLQKERENYRRQYITALSRDLLARRSAAGRAVAHRLESGQAEDAELLARTLCLDFGCPALICHQRRFYLRLPEDCGKDLRLFLRENGPRLGLKGGGSADFIQGIMTGNSLEKIEQALQNFIK